MTDFAMIALIAAPLAVAKVRKPPEQRIVRTTAVRTRVAVRRAERVRFTGTDRRTTERVEVRKRPDGRLQIDFR